MQRVLLLGAGHAHLAVLAALARTPLAGAQCLLVTPHEHLVYSGLLPALLSGRCALADCSIPVAPWAAAAGVHLRLGRAVAVEAAARRVVLADGTSVPYDLLSIDVGSTLSRDRWPGAREHALFLRPVDELIAVWPQLRARNAEQPLALVVIGGGAAAVELALALQHAFGPRSRVTLVAEPPVPAGHGARAQRRVHAALQRAGVQWLPALCDAVEAQHVVAGRMRVACDIALVATGGEAPPWLAGSGLALDAQGFVRIGPTLQSVSHAEVFAAGDVSARDDRPHPRNGVHAIRAGAVLAHNLRQALKGGPLRPYRPPSSTLALLDLTDGRAIASRGAWSAQGWLMGAWKRHIDRAFMARWQRETATAAQPPKK